MDNIHKGYGKCEKYLEKSGKLIVRKSGNPDIGVCVFIQICANSHACLTTYMHIKISVCRLMDT